MKLTNAPATPTNREILAPRKTLYRRSRPLRSVPNRCWLEGGRKLLRATSLAPIGDRAGPQIATRATQNRMIAETIAAGFRRSLSQGDRESVVDHDSPIEKSIQNVDRQIENHEQGTIDNHDTGQQKAVTVKD